MNNICIQLEQNRNNILYLFKEKVRIQYDNIIMLEAKGNYTVIHLRFDKNIIIAKTLKSLEMILSPYQFYRIHRAFLINGSHLQNYNSDLGEVTLTNNHRVMTSRRRKISFEGRIVRENY